MTFVGLTALSVDTRTNVSTPNVSAASATFFVPKYYFYRFFRVVFHERHMFMSGRMVDNVRFVFFHHFKHALAVLNVTDDRDDVDVFILIA